MSHATPEFRDDKQLYRVLSSQLQQLKCQNDDRYDPARFRFIESLLERSNRQNSRVRQRLENKVQAEIKAYQVSLAAAKAKFEAQFVDMKTQFPEAFEQAQIYFEQGDFHRLSRHLNQYTSRHQVTYQSISSLAELTNSLANDQAQEYGNNTQGSPPILNELMLQQERKVLQATGTECKIDPGATASVAVPSPKPLKANLRYQHRQRQQQVNHFMNSVMAAKPSNPGPLNPERLAIELLREMYALSPEYFKHCLSNFETLLWLEKSQNVFKPKKIS